MAEIVSRTESGFLRSQHLSNERLRLPNHTRFWSAPSDSYENMHVNDFDLVKLSHCMGI